VQCVVEEHQVVEGVAGRDGDYPADEPRNEEVGPVLLGLVGLIIRLARFIWVNDVHEESGR
jgi:hypothetical protein